MNRTIGSLLTACMLSAGWFTPAAIAQVPQVPYYQPYNQSYQLNRLFYYPHHYFPHNYWPAMSPQWPEGPGMPYQRPPAYQAYPAFREPGWRHELWSNQRYYKGSHFWLDQF